MGDTGQGRLNGPGVGTGHLLLPQYPLCSEECRTGTLRQTHPIQRRSFETALKNSNIPMESIY